MKYQVRRNSCTAVCFFSCSVEKELFLVILTEYIEQHKYCILCFIKLNEMQWAFQNWLQIIDVYSRRDRLQPRKLLSLCVSQNLSQKSQNGLTQQKRTKSTISAWFHLFVLTWVINCLSKNLIILGGKNCNKKALHFVHNQLFCLPLVLQKSLFCPLYPGGFFVKQPTQREKNNNTSSSASQAGKPGHFFLESHLSLLTSMLQIYCTGCAETFQTLQQNNSSFKIIHDSTILRPFL